MMFALILAVSLGLSCGGNSDHSSTGVGKVPIPRGDISLSAKTVQQTTRGARVESENGLSAEQLAQIDEGLTQAFNAGRASGWVDNGKAFNYSLYKVQIPVEPCRPSRETQTPSFLVRGDNYDGSVYDQYNSKGLLPENQQTDFNKYVKDGAGVVFAAELLTGLNTPGSTVNGSPSIYASFVVCPDASVLTNGTRYGAEHAIVAHFDSDYFNETHTHSTIAHPILPKRTAARGLVTTKPVPVKNPVLPIIRAVE